MKKMLFGFLALALVLAACSPAENTPTVTQEPTTGYAAPADKEPAQTETAAGYPAQGEGMEIPTPAGYAAPETPNTNISLQVIRPNGEATLFSAEQFSQLPTTKVSGHAGVRLTDLIAAVGVSDYSEVVLDAADKTMSYTKAQITDTMILANVGNTGGMFFLSSDLAEDQWLHNIVSVKIK